MEIVYTPSVRTISDICKKLECAVSDLILTDYPMAKKAMTELRQMGFDFDDDGTCTHDEDKCKDGSVFFEGRLLARCIIFKHSLKSALIDNDHDERKNNDLERTWAMTKIKTSPDSIKDCCISIFGYPSEYDVYNIMPGENMIFEFAHILEDICDELESEGWEYTVDGYMRKTSIELCGTHIEFSKHLEYLKERFDALGSSINSSDEDSCQSVRLPCFFSGDRIEYVIQREAGLYTVMYIEPASNFAWWDIAAAKTLKGILYNILVEARDRILYSTYPVK
jgi:hypothetical protein